jgi:hypothetical protein
MVFTDRVADITYQDILPSIVDFVNNSNVFTAKMLTNTKNWKGITENQPITIANSATGGSFDGMDVWPTAATNNTRQLTWYVKAYEQSVVVPGIEKAVNGNSEKQVLSLVASRLDEGKNSMADAIGTLFYSVGSGKDFDGLGLIVDNGTLTSSYGGITRASLPSVNADVTTVTGGVITLDYLSSEFDNVSAASSAQESPTLGLTTKAVFSFIESLLSPTVNAMYTATSVSGYNRVSGGTPTGVSVKPGDPILKGAAGFNAITYRGFPVVADDKAPTGTFFWLNEQYLEFRRLLSPDLKSVSSNDQVTEGVYQDVEFPSFLQLRDWMSPVNQFGEIGALVLMGNLICRQPRRMGKLVGITGV